MAVNNQKKSQIISRQRVAERGEVFTAEREVNAMLDLVANECLRPDSRFLEPACGNGNFLTAILKRKLSELRRKYKNSPYDYEKQAIVAIGSLQTGCKVYHQQKYHQWKCPYSYVCRFRRKRHFGTDSFFRMGTNQQQPDATLGLHHVRPSTLQ